MDVFTNIWNILGHTIIYEYFGLKWKVLRTLKNMGIMLKMTFLRKRRSYNIYWASKMQIIINWIIVELLFAYALLKRVFVVIFHFLSNCECISLRNTWGKEIGEIISWLYRFIDILKVNCKNLKPGEVWIVKSSSLVGLEAWT